MVLVLNNVNRTLIFGTKFLLPKLGFSGLVLGLTGLKCNIVVANKYFLRKLEHFFDIKFGNVGNNSYLCSGICLVAINKS